MNIVIIGPQGSGKTTQAELLADKLHLPHLQTGEMYRLIARQNTPLGRQIKQAIDNGQLVPDQIHNQMLINELSKPKYRQGFVMDGSPRTLDQAENMTIHFDRVFYLRVSDLENINRLLLRKRVDDTPELIRERLKIYHQQTEPVLEFYRQQGILTEINGERSIQAIFDDLYHHLLSNSS